MGLPLDLEGLVVDVERGVVVLAEDPLAVPIPEESSRAAVPVLGGVVTRLFAVQLEPDDVVRARLVELLLQRRVDHVVRRGDHVGHRADSCDVVTNTPERLNLGHRDSSHRSGFWPAGVQGLKFKNRPRREKCQCLDGSGPSLPSARQRGGRLNFRLIAVARELAGIPNNQVPISQLSRYLRCSSVRLSMAMPIVCSFRTATHWSTALGTS